MMNDAAAIQVAIDLLHLPSRVRLIRSTPLPNGVLILLRIAAGDEDAIVQASEFAGRSRDTIRKAAAFFIEQILLSPDADSYRILGAGPEATRDELRRNMALLLRWLHPDLDRQGERSIFAARVTLAWDQLKTHERRASYDKSSGKSLAKDLLLRKKHRGRGKSGKQISKRHANNGALHCGHVRSDSPISVHSDERGGLLRRALIFLFGRAKHW